jgi:hypothetical protein
MTFPLGAPLADGYDLTPQDRGLRTRMDGCNARVRKRISASPITAISAAWIVDGPALSAFRAWFASAGHDWFDLALAGPLGVETVSARITGGWEASPIMAGRWRLSMPIEVRAFTALGAEYIEALTAYTYNDITNTSPALHTWVSGAKPAEYYP